MNLITQSWNFGKLILLANGDYLESRASRTPMKEPGGMQPILKTVDYILDNTYLTGQILYCDGGEQLL
ncbi:hypothetical protein L3073_09500 [Ancylomarina sp. DW003]|nr:hypothetical protein [Ancylomarina sp. DW003]MDE5422440.1 hypothetical protein [Ancylomarina sp. DW003]